MYVVHDKVERTQIITMSRGDGEVKVDEVRGRASVDSNGLVIDRYSDLLSEYQRAHCQRLATQHVTQRDLSSLS